MEVIIIDIGIVSQT